MKIPATWLAPAVVLLFLGIILVGNGWELPSMQTQLGEATGNTATTEMIVDGLHCRGTSNFLIKKISTVPGIISVSTYVQEHKAVLKFDPKIINPQGIQAAIETPVQLGDGRIISPFTVQEILK